MHIDEKRISRQNIAPEARNEELITYNVWPKMTELGSGILSQSLELQQSGVCRGSRRISEMGIQ